MTDIHVRMIDYLDRQLAALESVGRDWGSMLQYDECDDATLDRLESLQRAHQESLGPLQAEFACLSREWSRAEVPESARIQVRAKAAAVSVQLARVQSMESTLRCRLERHMEQARSSAQQFGRARKITRRFGASGPNEAQLMDRDA